MKPISYEQIVSLQHAKQHFCDCYLVSSLNSLTRTQNGRKILSQNIKVDWDGLHVAFNKVKGGKRDYFITTQEIDDLVLLDKYYNEVEITTPHNPIVKAVEIAMNKLIIESPSLKPFISKLIKCQELFEYNKPSNFMEIFTGITPISLNEDSFRLTMKSKKDELIEILENIDKNNGGSFVLGTGRSKPNLPAWHCYTIEGVNAENRYAEFVENRYQKKFKMNFDNIAKLFKFIVGYYNDMLK